MLMMTHSYFFSESPLNSKRQLIKYVQRKSQETFFVGVLQFLNLFIPDYLIFSELGLAPILQWVTPWLGQIWQKTDTVWMFSEKEGSSYNCNLLLIFSSFCFNSNHMVFGLK